MRYSKPRLHSLADRSSRGNCATGSAASSVSDTCTDGNGINNTAMQCMNGAGDPDCANGAAAYWGHDGCNTGTGANSTCWVGGTPVSCSVGGTD